ncbi:hypothetical protein AAZX31_20G092900 [Glycine max]|uniref:Transmembrane protein n=1 Tax=Glycine soja TaxID=3848 RepID=A0A445F359_GLYSO|nr:uncharacterized protein LOC114402997 [Glycine soja]RZB43253.1 hypothetical protein D0Y65_053716 [Glycine soja]
MNKAVISLYGLLGLFAGAILSSSICGTPKNFKAENNCIPRGKIETSLNNSTIPKTIYNGFLILAIKFVHYLISRGYNKSSAPYTTIVPFWVRRPLKGRSTATCFYSWLIHGQLQLQLQHGEASSKSCHLSGNIQEVESNQ